MEGEDVYVRAYILYHGTTHLDLRDATAGAGSTPGKEG